MVKTNIVLFGRIQYNVYEQKKQKLKRLLALLILIVVYALPCIILYHFLVTPILENKRKSYAKDKISMQ